MKQIQPKQIWYNGSEYMATVINYYGTWDNHLNQCMYFFALYTGTVDQTEIELVKGNLTMDNPEYTELNVSPNGNAYVEQWIENKLNVVII